MNDEEGVIQTVEVTAKFVNGKPEAIEAVHVMRSPDEWDRFMRFMQRYAEENGLDFVQVNSFNRKQSHSFLLSEERDLFGERLISLTHIPFSNFVSMSEKCEIC